ncbi:MAG: M48 family metalloprotease [Bacteriovoracaceae bacterium]|nr:M48 family metalloprotease [Bacteriovoracaceae bacterium]
MLKCPKCDAAFNEVLSRAGVMIDVCSSCSGVWFDQGELSFFVKSRKSLNTYREKGLNEIRPTNYACPHCKKKLRQGRIPEFNLEVEECETCQGLFFDHREFEHLQKSDKISAKKIGPAKPKIPIKVSVPSFGSTALYVLTGMYAAFFALMVFLVESEILIHSVAMAISIAFVFIQFFLGPMIMDWSLKLIGSLSWLELHELPEKYRLAVEKITKAQKIAVPRLGLIDDMTPQAYTYGQGPRSARLVLSKGLVELLEKDEVEAVVAHEFGHIKNWDFLIMTIAQLAPVLFYHLYRYAIRVKKGSSSNNNGKAGSVTLIAGIIAYFCYHISQFLVLFISRNREFHADRFSITVTKKPNALAKALIKIGYGLMGSFSKEKNEGDKKGHALSVQAFNIMNIETSKSLAVARRVQDNDYDEAVKHIMSWDLWSPWASFYELYSTHPLIAKRINAIAAQAVQMQLTPEIYFDLKKPESYWDDFIWDLGIYFLPLITASAALFYYGTDLKTVFTHVIPAFAVGGIIRTMCTYPGGSIDHYKIASLLKQIKVSPVRTYAVKIKGKIIGRGSAGIIFNEDMMLQDSTGIIYLNHEPIGFNIFFGLLKYRQYLDEEVIVEGWYRRTPSPFIEVKKISSLKNSSRSYTFFWKIFFWIFLMLLPMWYWNYLS